MSSSTVVGNRRTTGPVSAWVAAADASAAAIGSMQSEGKAVSLDIVDLPVARRRPSLVFDASGGLMNGP
jgi:hypothetical protein